MSLIKHLAFTTLTLLCTLPIHGETKPSAQHASVISAVEGDAQKAKCAKAAVSLDEWQSRFRLQDWEILLVCGPHKKMPGAYGITEMWFDEKRASVWVNVELERDPEEVVIHELLHIVVGRVDSPRTNEQVVWLLGQLFWESRGCAK